MSERVVTGLFMLVAILVVFFINSYMLNFMILAAVLYFGFKESLKFYDLNDKQNLVWVALAFYTLAFFTNPVYVAILAILVVVSVQAYTKANSLNVAYPFIYPTLPIFLIWMLYSEYGLSYLVWLIFAVVASDSAAYFVGKKFGKTPFSQSSPNKTKEGVCGGLFFGTLIGSMCGMYIYGGSFYIFIVSFLICVFGVFGDLFESYLKRNADVKDSGNVLGSHGGMLDRIDGYLFGAPALLWALSW